MAAVRFLGALVDVGASYAVAAVAPSARALVRANRVAAPRALAAAAQSSHGAFVDVRAMVAAVARITNATRTRVRVYGVDASGQFVAFVTTRTAIVNVPALVGRVVIDFALTASLCHR